MQACRCSSRRSKRPVRSDRKKVLDAIANGGPYQTIVGPIDLKTHIRGKQFNVGQWQSGEFVGIGPTDLPGAKPLVFPKPEW